MPLAAMPKAFLSALCVEKTMTPSQWVDAAAAELDLDGLEFHWGFVPSEPEEQIALRRHLEERSLTMPMMCYSPDFVTKDRAEWNRQVEAERVAIEATARLGGSYCRVLSGQRNPSVERDEGIAMVAEAIEALIPTASRAGVTLILENHYKDTFWKYPEFAQKRDLFLDLLAAIPESEWFGVNFDPSNALMAGDDPIELLNEVKNRVRTMHASDRFLTSGTLEDLAQADGRSGYADVLHHGVIGQGAIDYDAVFAVLREIGFNGWISIEDGDDPAQGMAHLQESAVFLRGKMAEYGVG